MEMVMIKLNHMTTAMSLTPMMIGTLMRWSGRRTILLGLLMGTKFDM